jgi:methionyl-tRNA synthetase
MISIIMPNTGKEILKQLGIKNASMIWDELENDKIPENTKVIEKGEPLFMRLDKEEEIDYIRQQMEGNGVK